ncbi:Type II restriction endonuclease [Mucinivorans hirudinis]|uniref:Type II restriction endonuclease n=1 Tax=Mucinivorans hirudinis TaxID=1433126 RepID=A0A060RDX9_9BACT|nr:Type II restriction endonuclease [Mucinivorans hirudinis]
MKFVSSFKLKLIYVFRINDEAHKGCLKVGEATADDNEDLWGLAPSSHNLNVAAKKRINQYTQTAGIAYDLLYTELAIYTAGGRLCALNDGAVREVLLRSGIKRKVFEIEGKANEWVLTDVETVKNAIKAAKEGRCSLNSTEISTDINPIDFRPEQKEAIKLTKKHFTKGNQFLWNAKMRFGKTLSALQVTKEMQFKRTLILTHRPVVDAGWFEDFTKIFYDTPNYIYGSKNNGDTHSSLERQALKEDKHYVYFASMQDLRGSEKVGGNFDKNNEIFATPWNFIIVDEAHEGTQTELGRAVMYELTKDTTKVLRLSGTPFNLIDEYKEDEIYTWDYVMEQRAKAEWSLTHFGDPNPYASLPRLNIYTYDLGKLIEKFADSELAFNFREFFRTDESGNFIHRSDVLSFLNLITKSDKESNYPYSTEAYRDNFRHSLWMVPGVKEARALSAMLQQHPVFQHFTIVNVAGDGDEEASYSDALKAVEDAIGNKPEETYTITLSCGRLTTGVSVKPWTAVMMLSGSFNTSASSYMQTIFRVQTPATIGGKVKEECFVFDFAPDRTLKVIAETAKISAKAGKTSTDDRKIMGEFLNFCPIIAVDGSQMRDYDVPRMLEQLKKVYVERVVKNGFEDGYLYNDDLMKLTDVDLQEFDNLKKIIGSTKAMPKSGDIDMNNQGFADEEYEQLGQAEKDKRKGKELTDEQKELLEDKVKKRKNRDTAVSILRGISIRMPLLIYGAELKDETADITLDNFTELIDPQSWEEFMPKGVYKQTFNSFKKYYDPEIFCAAGKRIRAMAKAADSLDIEERIERITNIFSTFRNPDKETVLTPRRVVNMHMGECMGGYVFYDEKYENTLSKPRFADNGGVADEVFGSDTKILEINSKTGLYPLYVAYSVYRSRLAEQTDLFDKTESDSLEHHLKIWDKVLNENIFVLCKTPMAKSITKRTLVGFRKAKVNARYFEDLINQITNKSTAFVEKVSQGKSYWKANENNNMKFKAIVGNPPYQVMDGGAQASAKPIYDKFVDIAKKIKPSYISMIMPSRWYAGGKGLDEFRENMLNDKHISLLHDFLNPEDVFPNTNIRGGLCFFLWSEKYDNRESLTKVITHQSNMQPISIMRSLKTENAGTFIRHGIALSIMDKVNPNSNNESLANYVSAAKAFGFRTFFINDEKFRANEEGLTNPVMCYGRGGSIGYVDEAEIRSHKEWIDLWKVYVSESNNIGTELNDDNQNSFVGKPRTICTETFLVVGAELSLDEISSQNLSMYLRSKFARFLHSLAKMSQHGTSKTYRLVPLQDFTEKSDIDWSKSTTEIDKQLYAKYGLTEDEIAFIESMIKPME